MKVKAIKLKQHIPCLNPACDKPAHSRGLCKGCYGILAKRVRQKKTTWDKLVSAGRATKAGTRGLHDPRVQWLRKGIK